MSRLCALGLAVALAGCGALPAARLPQSGMTASNGGGQAALGNVPRGSTNFPYGRQ